MKEIKVTPPTNSLEPDNSTTRRRYMPGIDGLRALSVIAVIAYHLDLNWAPGGLIGVGIFFVLSGYLITDQIIQRWKQDRRFDLKDFWIRRARRLLPAMFVMLFVTAMWLLLFDRSRLAALQGDFLSSTLYFNNWWLIFHDVSYFESFGPPSPIGHLWSLAIEEQFYFIWPLVIIVGLRLAPQRGKLIVMCLTGAFLSA
ncbi:acyltransferase family protein, partial [Paenibacillus sp. NPDC101420]